MSVSNTSLSLCYMFISVLSLISAARILAVFPVPSISHQVVFRPFTQELAKRGHDVVVITPDPVFPEGGSPSNLTEIDVHDISYNIWKEIFMTTSKGHKDGTNQQIQTILEALKSIVDAQLKHEKVRKLLEDQSQHFDLVVVEACVRSALIFSYIYKAPLIQMSSLGAVLDNFDVIGGPTHPIIYPNIFRQKLNNLTLWDKIVELYTQYEVYSISSDMKSAEDEMLKKHFGPNVPSVTELSNNVDMLFLNVNPVFEGIRPVPPGVIYMGGLHQKPSKELPTDLKSYLDSSKNGVIYISFGTNVDSSLLPADKIETLVRTVSKLPYDVLWKWDDDKLPGRTKNIKISKWFPQSDLLKHPKIKAFVTQGGLQSTDEAITAGVPLIGIPMLGDQWFNVEKYISHGIGVRLDMETLTEEQFKNAITTVIDDKSYRVNIAKLRELMRDQPMRPLDRAIWWTEYVLRHGGAKHLRCPAANITWTEYLELELVFTVLAGLLVTAILIGFAIRVLYTKVMEKYVVFIKTKCD